MINKKLNIIHISAEVHPFSKTGGLSDVARSLPKAQKRLGHEVSIITPFYGKVIDKKKHNIKLIEKNIKIEINSKDTAKINIYKGYLMHGLPVYFIENTKYFSRRKTLYGSTHENARFMLFGVATLRLINMMELRPDIIHCHDWHTGLIPYYIKTKFHYAKDLQKVKTIFTIHNLIFQMGVNWWKIPPKFKDYGKSKLPRLDDPKIEYINYAKRAIMNADIINTVSENYAEEIMTKKFGQDLHRILKNRQHKLFGIINGIDYTAYNPMTDHGLKKKYNSQQINNRKTNKKYLQKKLGLKIDADIPLVVMTSRISYEKGLELILKIMEHLLKLNIQLIFMGDGNKKYIQKLKKYSKKHPKKIIWLPFKQKIETIMYAASDFLLLPSNHEPCGLTPIIGMRYGCIPIVTKIGGLYDTVENYNPAKNTGTGFVFNNFNSYELYGAIVRANEFFKNKAKRKQIIVRDMQESNSWEIPAKKYIDLYCKAMNGHK